MTDTLDLRAYDAVLLDLDGTIWHEEVALPGAIELIRSLQQRGQPYAFVSNSGLSPARLVERLGRMGAVVEARHVYTAASAACDYVRQHFPLDQHFPIDRATPNQATTGRRARVFSVASTSARELLGNAVEWIAVDASPCDVVMSASLISPDATLPRFQMALRHLLHGAPLVALCADRRYPTPRGAEIGSGGVAAMLACAAHITPIYCGKPQRLFFEELCGHLNVPPARCVLIGDNLEADVAGARPLGMASILPLTGVTSREQLALIETNAGPDFVVNDLRELV